MGDLIPKTQGTAKFLIVRPVDDKDKVSIEDQKLFWSSIRILLYLVKHSRSGIACLTWEFSKVHEVASTAEFLKHHHIIKYVHYIRNLWLMIGPTGD